ncbi:hypothetical protein [Ktedonospora formicarum]|uniref:Uncharacterized protein n=1 Tax=Ktedonospora formicarum TaxID=2778364 RepID=A0A8J3I8S0_9CHLR|nr:hypothetical protein [Ktedonospora formicarum]GHO48915.1 hypothetical protein KSX_70780 [Ktedonospora formicarum]
MTYALQNRGNEYQEAHHIAEQLTASCKQLHIPLDAIDWQQLGMQASVKVDRIEIASLLTLSRRTSADLLRSIQIKLFEHAALKAIHAHPHLKALMWAPVDVVQPQAFLSLWIVTTETDERVPITESLQQGRRVYEPYRLDGSKEQLLLLFGPMGEGTYPLGEKITFQVRERHYTGEICYILSPGKNPLNRKYVSKGSPSRPGNAYASDSVARYLVHCHDGFPHIVTQLQITDKGETPS